MARHGEKQDHDARDCLPEVQQHVITLKIAFNDVENDEQDGYEIPPVYECMSICDDLRDIGPAAKSAIPQILALLKLAATNDDKHLLHLRAAHAHFAITGEPELCLDKALRVLDIVSKKRFSEDSPPDHDETFWLRAWACDLLGEMGVLALPVVERLKRIALEDGCTFVRELARHAIEKIMAVDESG